MALTFFVAALKCVYCGNVSPADTSTNMQSHLLPHPGDLRVGDAADVHIEDFESSYFKLRDPAPGGPVTVLETWNCPYCHAQNWAFVIFQGQVVRDICSVRLNTDAIDKAQFISDLIEEWCLDHGGEHLSEGLEPAKDIADKVRKCVSKAEAENEHR